MKYIIVNDTPLENPPIINRFIQQINQNYRLPSTGGIYTDTQNVHNHAIQESIREAVFNLLKDNKKPPSSILDEIIGDEILTESSKRALVEYYNDKTEHSTIGLTFGDVLVPVWIRICKHKDKDEILKILNTEILDSEGMCFTGRISRLVNCLNGFYDDIVIRIDDASQIASIIAIEREKLEGGVNGGYTVDKHNAAVRAQLTERGYTEDVINVWTIHIE